MKLEIIPKEIAIVVIPVKEFREHVKATLNIKEAIFMHAKIKKNNTDYDNDMLKERIFCNSRWGIILNLYLSTSETSPDKYMYPKDDMIFRFYQVIYEDKIEYENYAKSGIYDKIILKEKISSGEDIIMIDNVVADMEYSIDNWIAMTTWPYTRSEWEKNL